MSRNHLELPRALVDAIFRALDQDENREKLSVAINVPAGGLNAARFGEEINFYLKSELAANVRETDSDYPQVKMMASIVWPDVPVLVRNTSRLYEANSTALFRLRRPSPDDTSALVAMDSIDEETATLDSYFPISSSHRVVPIVLQQSVYPPAVSGEQDQVCANRVPINCFSRRMACIISGCAYKIESSIKKGMQILSQPSGQSSGKWLQSLPYRFVL